MFLMDVTPGQTYKMGRATFTVQSASTTNGVTVVRTARTADLPASVFYRAGMTHVEPV